MTVFTNCALKTPKTWKTYKSGDTLIIPTDRAIVDRNLRIAGNSC